MRTPTAVNSLPPPLTPTHPIHPPRCRRGIPPRGPARGFTMAEAAVACLIVGVLTVAALQTVGAAVTARRSHALMRQGDLLARQLLDEVTQARYAEPCDAPVWGREAGEAATVRSAWDDVDDYDGLSESSPTTRSGSPVPGATGWQLRVKVERLNASSMDVVSAAVDTGLKRITVVAISPGGVRTSLVGLRTDGGSHDRQPQTGEDFVTWVGVSIQIGEDGGVVSSGTALLNLPSP